MKRPYVLLSAAWLVHAVAWFLPVAPYGGESPLDFPGLTAFVIASCPVLRCEDTAHNPWYGQVLATVSAVTTVLFVLASPWVVWRGPKSLQRVCAWAAVLAFLTNAHWYFPEMGRSGLRIGYFLWWWSFLLLAIGLFDLARQHAIERLDPRNDASALGARRGPK